MVTQMEGNLSNIPQSECVYECIFPVIQSWLAYSRTFYSETVSLSVLLHERSIELLNCHVVVPLKGTSVHQLSLYDAGVW